jgi:hypothetical protein
MVDNKQEESNKGKKKNKNKINNKQNEWNLKKLFILL